MSTRSPPVVPPRPARSPNPPQNTPSGTPKIPPRPVRRTDRSSSPKHHDSFAPSPLNEPPKATGLGQTPSHESSSVKPPARPPSVSLPSVGEEGMEYAALDSQNPAGDVEENGQIPQPVETRSVERDLYLHAPKPSLPSSSAKEKVRVVTGTTAQQAAAIGIGKPMSPEPVEPERPIRSMHARESSAVSTHRLRESSHFTEEHAVPESGQRVPMDPDAGDVQAPTPAVYGAAGELQGGRGHSRTRSAREASLPPGSYGLHGHGVQPTDRFEKEWYEKHPDELTREEGQYGGCLASPRPEWVKTSEELNRIVQSSAGSGVGLGTSSEFLGTPDEEVGYIATEELASRLTSPPPRRQESARSQPPEQSPLHKAETVPAREETGETQSATESGRGEVEIHISEPLHHQHHPDGFVPGVVEQEPCDSNQVGQDDGDVDDVPILAADEAVPGVKHMQPAISPNIERRPSSVGPEGHERPKSSASSRQSHRFTSSTRFNSQLEEHEDHQLEDVEEYEPLFPEEDDKAPTPEDRLKQSSIHQQRRFPSKDVWEDAPESLQLQTTVSTPDVPQGPKEEEAPEVSEQDIDRSKMVKRKSSEETPSHLPDRKALGEVKQRFPSRDIWEDAPESQRLTTTVQEPEKEDEAASPDFPMKPSIPVIPPRPSKHTTSRISPEDEQSKVANLPVEPRMPPAIPERPKPPVPARPSRPKSRGPDQTLAKVTSTSSTESATDATPPSKPKPAVPARPVAPKISSLKAGFLSDLNNRLKLGPKPPPQQEKKAEEQPVSKGPLSDARKGRARGPARRKPATISQVSVKTTQPHAPKIKLVDPWTAWHIDSQGILVVGEPMVKAVPSPTTSAPEVSSQKETVPEYVASNDEGTEESAFPSIIDGAKEQSESSSPAAESTPSSSNVDVQKNTVEPKAETKSKAEPELDLEPEPDQQAAEGPKAETEKFPSEEDLLTPLSPQGGGKASEVIAEEESKSPIDSDVKDETERLIS
ncbi:hypothetical protein VTO42DRAFT_3428 [Malbranchea cinnamomea]